MSLPPKNAENTESGEKEPSPLVPFSSDGRGNWFCVLCDLLRPLSGLIPMLVILLFLGALFWAKGRDPFQRRWFNVKPEGFPKAECIAVLPKMVKGPLPVVIFLHGSGASLLGVGNDLRLISEMGLAAVGMEYDQTNSAAFEAQFAALNRYLQRQSWADTNAIAWVGFSLGAQRALAFALAHPNLEPSLLVRISGGWIAELENRKSEIGNRKFPKVLLVHGGRGTGGGGAANQWRDRGTENLSE